MPFAVALIHQNDDGDAFGISFPDFPGAISAGATAEEAITRGSALLNFHIAGMVEDGETIPQARTIEQLQADANFREDAKGAMLALVQYDAPGKAVRINITVEENLLSSIDTDAKSSGSTRSGWLAEAAKQRLRKTG